MLAIADDLLHEGGFRHPAEPVGTGHDEITAGVFGPITVTAQGKLGKLGPSGFVTGQQVTQLFNGACMGGGHQTQCDYNR